MMSQEQNHLVRLRIKRGYAYYNNLPTHTFKAYLERETEKAIMIVLPQSMVLSDKRQERWIPKSCVLLMQEV